jgi:PTH1 family peptidyl-tRNA hydrolase
MSAKTESVGHVVFGLGNPGAEYQNTPHNLGFRVVDTLASQWRKAMKPGPGSFWWTAASAKHQTVLVKPTTFMNRSGEAVRQVLERFQLSTEQLLVVCDDLQLPLGRIRLRPRGGDGGHKGLESVIYHLSSEEFARLRVGIGGGESPEHWVEHVLSPVPKDLEPQIETIIRTATEVVECWIREGIDSAMNRYNAGNIL